MLNLQYLESIKRKYYFYYLNGIDTSDHSFEEFLLTSSYHSSKIHGCNFDLPEAAEFLHGGKPASGKDFFDYLILENIYDAQKWFFSLFSPNFVFDMDTLIKLNSRLLNGIDYRSKSSGDYLVQTKILKGGIRKDSLNLINDNSDERETGYRVLKQSTMNLLDELHYKRDISLDWISHFYTEFLRLKPFDMGNGRTLRILINYVFFKGGLPLISFDEKDREIYEGAVSFENNNHDKLTDYFGELIGRTPFFQSNRI